MKKIFYIYFLLLLSFLITTNAQTFKVTDKVSFIDKEGEIFMAPLWSPDGSKIALTSEGYKGIWVYNIENENLKQITDENAAGYKMKWSPDSKSILTRVAKYEGIRRYNAVKVYNVETGESNQLTDYRTMMPGLPQWTDAGAKVFLYGRGETETFNSGFTNETEKNLASEKVVYLRDDKIAVEDIDENQIAIFEPVNGQKVLNLQLSPDGERVSFEIIGGNMYVMNIDGTGLTDLGKGYRPKWSPDSQYLTYMISEDDGHNIVSSDIFSIRINGSEKTNLTNTNDKIEMNPDWSPDGKRIAYDLPDDGAIYVLEIEKR